MKTLAGILLVAGAATLGDFIWFTYGVEHNVLSGVVHGALLLMMVGGVLGWLAGRFVRGLPIGAIAGIGGAMSYYTIIALTGGRTYGTAIPASWVILWLVLAALDGRWLRAPAQRSWPSIAIRGLTAALAGALAFSYVMPIVWGRPPAGGRNYLVQWLAWAVAWAPGILALAARGESRVPKNVAQAPRPIAAGASARESPHESDSTRPAERSITATDLLARIDRGDAPPILDVRSEGEFAAGHVPGAMNIPFNQVPSRLTEVPGAPGEDLIVYCGHGPRAYVAAMPLRYSAGRHVIFLTGHWSSWQADGLPSER
jgi:rhodanese-related sulfurtransferase